MAKKDQREAAERIKKALKAAQAYLKSPEGMAEAGVKEPIESRVYVHENKDGTVDGQLSIPLPPRVSVTKLSIAIDHGLPATSYTWITSGIRGTWFKSEEEDAKLYTRYRGQSEAFSFPQRMTKTKKIVNLATLDDIAKNMRKKRRRKAEQIIVRLHWNPENKKPERR